MTSPPGANADTASVDGLSWAFVLGTRPTLPMRPLANFNRELRAFRKTVPRLDRDLRHRWASQGVMNGVGLVTVGRLLGHRQRETTAIYAHLDDGALRDAATQATAVVARAMGYRAEALPQPYEAEDDDTLAVMPEFSRPRGQVAPGGVQTPLWLRTRDKKPVEAPRNHELEDPPRNSILENPRGGTAESCSGAPTQKDGEPRNMRGLRWY